MDQQSKKLVLSKETLLSLEDQDLAGVVGGQGLALIETVVCQSGVCQSAVCQSAVCHILELGL